MVALSLYDLCEAPPSTYRRAVGAADDARRLRLASARGLPATVDMHRRELSDF